MVGCGQSGIMVLCHTANTQRQTGKGKWGGGGGEYMALICPWSDTRFRHNSSKPGVVCMCGSARQRHCHKGGKKGLEKCDRYYASRNWRGAQDATSWWYSAKRQREHSRERRWIYRNNNLGSRKESMDAWPSGSSPFAAPTKNRGGSLQKENNGRSQHMN